jgi:hypothetical protein
MMIDLTSLGAISERLDSLHDCPFDLDQAQFDMQTHEWLGRFLRPLWDGPDAQHRRRAFLVLESQLPVVEARLCLRAVTEVRIIDDQGIGRYTFNRVKRIKGGLQLVFNEELKIDVALSGEPAGTYEEVPVADIHAVYRQVLFIQSGPTLQFGPGASTDWAV